MDPLRITYLMEDTALSGGVRVILAQADALIERGHSVTIATKGAALHWRSSSAEWLHLDDFRSLDPESADVFVATFWTTVEPLWRLAPEKAVHLCQGYEALISYYENERPEIEHAYRLPMPVIIVSHSLADQLKGVTDDVTWVGQIVDDGFYQPNEAESSTLRVLLVGAAEIDMKGIDLGYDAVSHARWSGCELELVRVSPWRPSGGEPADVLANEFHVALSDGEMQRVVRSCSVVLGTSAAEEGFGLPVAEAMASGLAPILTRIPSYLSFHPGEDWAKFVDRDPYAMGDALIELAEDDSERRRLARRSREVAESFRSHLVGERLEQFFRERLLDGRDSD